MASDLSSGCTEPNEVLDEKEEGEISLEDVSSSEEGHLNYGCAIKPSQCPNCLCSQHCTTWCTASAKFHQPRHQNRRDAVQGKENRHHIKESGCTGTKHIHSTLQEKNDDLVLISSDSDMEIVGLEDNSKQIVVRSLMPRIKKKRKKKHRHASAFSMDDLVSSSSVDVPVSECISTLKHSSVNAKGTSLSRTHHRDVSPIHRSSRMRLVSRSPPRRHRSPVRARSPFKKSRSPVLRGRSPIARRSPRRLKSPKRSPYQSPTKTTSSKALQTESLPTSHNYDDSHGTVNKLLKKVRHLDSVGTHSLEATLNRNKEHASSLKEKLSNMMKSVSDNNGNVTNYCKEKSAVNTKEGDDADDEEDLALLRQKALETKQQKSNKRNEQPKTEPMKNATTNIHNDEDEEDLELRMIALRSAVLKKHQNRIQRGIKSGKSKRLAMSRSESPFTQSFLDSIPIPGEELLNFVSPPHTPPPINEDNHTEDMELDTDIEREKEKLPYSPTDKITGDIPIDMELLGIQPSDVSFINLNEANNSSAFGTVTGKNEQKFVQLKILENRSYMPSTAYYMGSHSASYDTVNSDMYSNSARGHRSDFANSKRHNSHSPRNIQMGTQNTSNYKEMNSCHGLSATSVNGSVSPTDSMITIDDLLEIDVDTSPSADTLRDAKNAEYIPENFSSNLKEITPEPLYMQGVPDITKEANKIPTLIDRTLVPVPILKSNKQLQQPLPTRKHEVHPEPTFKSANMRPVAVDEEISARTNTSFKPMKLLPHTQKSCPVLTTPVAFHNSLQKGPINEASLENSTPSLERKDVETDPVESNVPTNMKSSENASDATAPTNKKKKPAKKGFKRKNSTSELNAKKIHTDKDDRNTVNIEINTAAEKSTVLKEKSLDNKDDKSENGKSVEECKVDTETADTNSNKDNTIRDLVKDTSNTSADKNVAQTECEQNSNSQTKDTVDRNAEVKNDKNVTDGKATSSTPVPEEQVKSTDSRRQSLDEDEEALRAILLASLPKRSKTADTNVSTSVPTTINQTVQPSTPPIVKTTVASNSNSASPVPSKHPTLSIPENDSRLNVEKKLNVTTAKGNSAQAVRVTVPFVPGRKRPLLMAKGPQKKLIRKTPIPASTKVVNNAKKYQNSIVQKKLILQKDATTGGNQKPVQGTSVGNAQTNENKWSANTKASLGDTQRIVISLGSDTESDSESEQQKKKAGSTACSTPADKSQLILIPTTEFEKNLEQFLRDVRKKQESVTASRSISSTQTTKKDTSSSPQTEKITPANLHTPLAVRHLPASQQEEYRRLKQQIIEREKLKLRRTIENNINNSNASRAASLKNQNAATQQPNKENNLKNINATKTASKSMVNLNIKIASEKTVSPNGIGNKVSGNAVTPVSTPRTIPENTSSSQDSTVKNRVSSGLKILTKNEVNRKYMEIQVKRDTDTRLVTVNTKVTPNEKAESNRNENLPESKNIADRDFCDPDINTFVQTVEEEIVANDIHCGGNEIVDSDASTIMLPRENQNTDSRDSFDTTQSTILLSQYQEDRRMSIASNAEKSESNGSSLFNNNIPPDNKASIEGNGEAMRKDIKAEINTLINLPLAEQERHLKDTEQKLVMKRYTILDELAEMSGSLRQWHMERDLQTNLVAEVKKLREQLKVAEERLQLQRNRIKTIGPKVVTAHRKIHVERRECFKLAKVCSVLGTKIVGEEYKVPEAGAQLLDNRLKEVANHTRQLSKKKVPSIDIPEVSISSMAQKVSCATYTELSFSDDSLSETCNITNADITTSSETTHCGESNENPENTELESTAIDVRETNEQREVEASGVQDTEQSISEQDNNTLSVQPELNSTPVVSGHCDKEENNQALECLRPSTSSECCIEKFSKADTEPQTKKALVPYVSILTHLKVPRNTNPNGVLCPYELMGTCNDGDCQFVHQPESQAK